MEEKSPPGVSHEDKNGTHEEEGSSSSSSKVKELIRRKKVIKSRFYTIDDDDDDADNGESGSSGEEVIECSGKYCRSCTGGLIADCVAICCCPCALVNLLILAFVKVPWMIGRKCLRKAVKMKKKKSRSSRNMEMTHKRSSKFKKSSDSHDDDNQEKDDSNGNLKMGSIRVAEDGIILELIGNDQEEIFMASRGSVSARFEAERVWLELYKDGHLGFGRVSFTGIQ